MLKSTKKMEELISFPRDIDLDIIIVMMLVFK